jgi:hypothetical protein
LASQRFLFVLLLAGLRGKAARIKQLSKKKGGKECRLYRVQEI